jgi:excisionase family DNA binding protein
MQSHKNFWPHPRRGPSRLALGAHAAIFSHQIPPANLTTAEVAKRLGLSVRQARRLIVHGPLDGFRDRGRLLVQPSVLKEFVASTYRKRGGR